MRSLLYNWSGALPGSNTIQVVYSNNAVVLSDARTVIVPPPVHAPEKLLKGPSAAARAGAKVASAKAKAAVARSNPLVELKNWVIFMSFS